MAWLKSIRESSARRELAMLRDHLSAILKGHQPGMLAAIDQHAAAVRDILGLTAGAAGPVELAAYAQGVRDAAAERGWRIESVSERDDWVTLRLLGTVSMASSDLRSGLQDLPQL
jgi:hypothetical protein